MNRRLDVAPISPASAADVGEILIEVGHSADVYGVTNNYGEVLSGGFPGCLLPTQTRKPRVPRGDPQRRGRRRAARRPRKPTRLDDIKNFHVEVQAGHVVGMSQVEPVNPS